MTKCKTLLLLPLLLLAACRSSSTTITSELGPGQTAEVVAFDARKVELENRGPGRLGVRFDTPGHSEVWLSAGATSMIQGRHKRRTIELSADQRPVSYRITEYGGEGISIQLIER